MKKNNLFRKMRSIDDKTLGAALTNHASVLRGVGAATEMLLRERRLWLVLHVVEVGAIVWLVFRG